MRTAACEDSLAHRAGGRAAIDACAAGEAFLPRVALDGKALARQASIPAQAQCEPGVPTAPPGRPGNARGEGWESTELPSHAPSRAQQPSRGFPVARAQARAWDSAEAGPEKEGAFP